MHRLVIALAVAAGCGSSPGPVPAPTPSEPAVSRDAAGEPARVAIDAAPRVADPKAAPKRGDACSTDTDCTWDDPCVPHRCIAGPRAPRDCDKSAPPPGTCTCIESQCTLRPIDPLRGASAPGCKSDGACAIDVGNATCELGGETTIGPILRQGPVCTCDPASTRCQWSYVAPIACESWRDCSWVTTPRLRPAPSKLVPRPVPQPVRACKDGEVDSVCKDKVCSIVAWKC